MPNHTSYVLDAAEMMIDATEHESITAAKELLKAVRKTYKSDVVTDAYELMSDPIRAKLHQIMSEANNG